MEILFFNNRSQRFFESLDPPNRSRAKRMFELLGQYQYDLGMPHSKALGNGLFELRIMGAIHIRFMYAFYNSNTWILHGFIKKTNQIPQRDLNYAKSQLKSLLQ